MPSIEIRSEDQLNNEILLKHYPQRIVSLVPSITLTLFDLGLENQIVGRTKFCNQPKDNIKQIPKIGGTKSLNINKIKSLNPDIIIANKEENEKHQIEELSQSFPIWISNVINLPSNYEFIHLMGKLTNKIKTANSIIDQTKAQFHLLSNFYRLRTAYFIWENPFMVAGKDTFIDAILEEMNLENVFKDTYGRYPIITLEQIKKKQPQLILLSDEPYPFKEKHISYFKNEIPSALVMLVKGEYFSWFGSKMRDTPKYLNQLNQQIG